ncbi:MAG: hypothetical protein KatS3mg095_0834 [Candidatus Parcubacteria bacterium]|nr:MAG: hypothetical protein KatS3mg095_0834 [Candidatus Parcubacteria bacterium]
MDFNNISNKEKIIIEKAIAENIVINKNQYFKYKIKPGDNLEKIARKFGLKINDIKNLNNLKNDKIIAGTILLIPQNVKITAKIPQNTTKNYYKPQAKYVSALEEVNGLLIPTDGLNQRKIHSNNGVDISTDCGTPVYSASDGIVIEAKYGYNSGYGNYILIQHKNFETLYGHLSRIFVEEGIKVNKGELIGLVGNTGFTIGKTGCHLHFETRGLKNPLAQ